ncbi:MAG: PAS domain S-box protein, partial [Deltaproteobacteria bacterium]|nr:PAS domain S-box protein [Deltaproteobacteria bacterium]
ILFRSFFAQASDEDREIDCSKIYFDGLSRIAARANMMLIDKRRALEEMRSSEEKYRNLFDTAMVGLFRSRLSDGLYLEVNEKSAALIGYKREDIVGKLKTVDLFQDLSQRKNLLCQLEKNGHVEGFEVDLSFPDGHEASYAISVTAYPDKDYMEGISIDITERRKAERLLKESEERFRNMAELLPEPIFESNAELVLTYANLQAFELFGFVEEDLSGGLAAADMFAPEELPKVMANTAAQFRGEKNSRTEYRCLKKDGTSFPALFHVSAIVKNGKPCGLRGVIVDLSEQKKGERLLRESEERFRNMADLLPGAVYETDMNRIFTYTNQSAHELFGYTKEDVAKGLDGIEMFVPEERPRVTANVAAQF